MFACKSERNDSSNAAIDLRRRSRQCRTTLSNAERADIAFLQGRHVFESSSQSFLGPKADGTAESVANVPLWLVQLERQKPRLKKQTLETPFARLTVGGCTLSIREDLQASSSMLWASVASKWRTGHGSDDRKTEPCCCVTGVDVVSTIPVPFEGR